MVSSINREILNFVVTWVNLIEYRYVNKNIWDYWTWDKQRNIFCIWHVLILYIYIYIYMKHTWVVINNVNHISDFPQENDIYHHFSFRFIVIINHPGANILGAMRNCRFTTYTFTQIRIPWQHDMVWNEIMHSFIYIYIYMQYINHICMHIDLLTPLSGGQTLQWSPTDDVRALVWNFHWADNKRRLVQTVLCLWNYVRGQANYVPFVTYIW